MARFGKPSMPDFSHIVLGAILLVRPLSLWEPFADRVFILIGLLIALSMRLLAAGQAGRPFRLPPAGLFLGAVAIAAAAFVFLRGPGVSRNGIEETADLVSAAVLFLLAYDAGSDPARARRLIAVAVAALAISSFYGLLQIISLERLRETVPGLLSEGKLIPGLEGIESDQHKELLDRLFTRRIFGTFILPNLFGGFLAALLPVAAGLLIDNLRRSRRDPNQPGRPLWLVPAAAVAVAVPAFFLARSYGAWLALAAAAAAFGAMALRRIAPDHPAARAAPWALAVLLAAGVVAFGLLVSKPAPRDDESSFAQRVHYWKAGLKSFAEAPVAGHGLGRFGEEYMRFRPPEADETQRAHSAYVEWAVEGGVVLLALFLAWFIAIGRLAVRGTADAAPAEAPPRASGSALPE
ncbi:MAG: O-antigen ligase family protein, partial [Planctomycetota bacterium]